MEVGEFLKTYKEYGEFLKEQYKQYYPNLGVFTNNSGKDILVKYEKVIKKQ